MEQVIDRLRREGPSGGAIVTHRAIAARRLDRRQLATAAGLALAVTVAWLCAAGWVGAFWGWLFETGGRLLLLPGNVAVARYQLGPYIRCDMPYLDVIADAPSARMWWTTAALTLMGFAATFRMPRERLPLIFLARAAALLQMMSLAYFAVDPGAFPYNVADYIADMLMTSLLFISLIPPVFGATYYIFDFGLPRMLGLTLLTLLHLSVFVPLQYLLHAWLVYNMSLLFLPLLYLAFGLSLDVMILVAFYAWGMSWKEREPAKTEVARITSGM